MASRVPHLKIKLWTSAVMPLLPKIEGLGLFCLVLIVPIGSGGWILTLLEQAEWFSCLVY